jgi:hypothetical protein
LSKKVEVIQHTIFRPKFFFIEIYRSCKITIVACKIASLPENLPALVHFKSNNKAEVIVKVVRESGRSETTVIYDIEWTPKGYAETV